MRNSSIQILKKRQLKNQMWCFNCQNFSRPGRHALRHTDALSPSAEWGWAGPFLWPCSPHQQTLIQLRSSHTAEFPVNLEVWCGSSRTHTRLTDLLVGGHWWPPLIPEALGEKEQSGNHKERPLQVVLNYVT